MGDCIHKDSGGAAFPFGEADPLTGLLVNGWGSMGMSLRDYFAAKAMQGLLSDLPKTLYGFDWKEKTAATAYEMADAMLKAREVRG